MREYLNSKSTTYETDENGILHLKCLFWYKMPFSKMSYTRERPVSSVRQLKEGTSHDTPF